MFDSHCHLDFIKRRCETRDFKFEGHDDHEAPKGPKGPKGTFDFSTLKELKQKLPMEFTKDFKGCIAVWCQPYTWMVKNYDEMFYNDPDVWYTFGCHPHFAEDFDASVILALRRALRHPKVVALGEIGLDYSRKGKNFKIQDVVFRMQLKLAMEYKLPICLHIRNADDDGMKIMLEEQVPYDYPIHLHCFTGCWADCQSWITRYSKLKVGFTIVRGNEAVLTKIPLDRILLETDSPYFYPHPGHINRIAADIARVKKVRISDVSRANLKNVAEVYKINLEVSEHLVEINTPEYSNMATPEPPVCEEYLEEHEGDECRIYVK